MRAHAPYFRFHGQFPLTLLNFDGLSLLFSSMSLAYIYLLIFTRDVNQIINTMSLLRLSARGSSLSTKAEISDDFPDEFECLRLPVV